MRFLVVGAGSIGRRHLNNLYQLGYSDLLACRSRQGGSEELEHEFVVQTYFDLGEALAAKPDAVLVTNPTVFHIPVALTAALAGCHVMIEKPLSHNRDSIQELVQAVQDRQLVTMVGYNFRFHAALRRMRELLREKVIGRPLHVRAEVGSYLPDWRPGTDYRNSYSASTELGGGVVLDLSHELDYLFWLFGQVRHVTAVTGMLGDLEISAEDTADIVMEHDSGVMSAIHLDYLDRYPVRRCRVVGTSGTLVLDFLANDLRCSALGGEWKRYDVGATEFNDTYIAELVHFIDCVQGKELSLVPLEEGVKALCLTLAVKQAAAQGVRVAVKYEA